jgi:hypothetical protein
MGSGTVRNASRLNKRALRFRFMNFKLINTIEGKNYLHKPRDAAI